MALAYKTPGVYIEEITTLPASVAQVETAIPVFIGHTQFALENGVAITEPKRLTSLAEYKKLYGEGPAVADLEVNVTASFAVESVLKTAGKSFYYMYDSIRLYFDNGGGDCYILSVGDYTVLPTKALIKAGLTKVEKYDEPTLIVMPDAATLSAADLHSLQVSVLQQCAKLQDRFGVFDLKETPASATNDWANGVEEFRKRIGMNNLKYGAAYTPWVQAMYDRYIPSAALTLKKGGAAITLNDLPGSDSPSVTTAILKKEETAASAANVKAVLDAMPAPNQPVQKQYRTLMAKTLATPTKENFTAVLAHLLEMIKPFGDWVKAGGAKELQGNLRLSVQSTIDTSVVDALKTLINYHKTASAGGNTALTDAVGTTYDAIKTALGVTHNAENDDALFGSATTLATKAAASQSKIDTLFSLLNDAIESAKSAANVAVQSADDTLYNVFPAYKSLVDAVNGKLSWLPPSGAIVGVYAATDRDRGVWKAPANVSLSNVNDVSYKIDSGEQERLNVDVTAGKSINAIRPFTGKGILVWGARTLAGNDNEWRYVSVRRFYNMVEESVQKSTSWVVFEPNDAGTWVRAKAMVENYLTGLWRVGALMGAKPEQAFFVNVGLGTTMTGVDVLEGRMIIEIGMAAVRPAEFIILRFSHIMPTA